jgi:hypothetical protein
MKTLLLELSKELTELCEEKGIKIKDSALHHVPYVGRDRGIWYSIMLLDYYDLPTYPYFPEGESSYPAYTLDELMEWLPEKSNYNSGEDIGIITISTRGISFKEKGITWFCGYYVEKSTLEESYWSYCTYDNEPVNAAGQLLINLIKEGHVK